MQPKSLFWTKSLAILFRVLHSNEFIRAVGSFSKRWVLKIFLYKRVFRRVKKATVIFEGPKNVLNNIFTCPETKPNGEASDHIYEETEITKWINNYLEF